MYGSPESLRVAERAALARAGGRRRGWQCAAPQEWEQEWAAAGFTAEEIWAWWRIGVNHPRDVPAGLKASDAAVAEMFGAATFPREWAGAGRACSGAINALLCAGRPAGEAVAITRALTAHETSPVRHSQMGLCETWCGVLHASGWIAGEGRDVDGFALAACLTVGMDLDEAFTLVRSGADMGPVRVMAALVDLP